MQTAMERAPGLRLRPVPGRQPFGRWPSRRALRVLVILTLLIAAQPLRAANDPSAICEAVAVQVATERDIPVSVMKAITLTETGRTRGAGFRPWPWTINMEGKGIWFDTAADARAYAVEHHKRGARSFDLGCFQINYKWHHAHFASIDAMLDPLGNARYAARFLLELFKELGSWNAAAGAYHSRSPEFATAYTERFAAHRARFLHEDGLNLTLAPVGALTAELRPGANLPVAAERRVNTFPLLQTGGATALGSLVPLGARGAPGALFGLDDAG